MHSSTTTHHRFEEYVRLVAVDTVGQLVGEIPRHKRSIVRLLREDPSQEVRAGIVLVAVVWAAFRRDAMWTGRIRSVPNVWQR